MDMHVFIKRIPGKSGFEYTASAEINADTEVVVAEHRFDSRGTLTEGNRDYFEAKIAAKIAELTK